MSPRSEVVHGGRRYLVAGGPGAPVVFVRVGRRWSSGAVECGTAAEVLEVVAARRAEVERCTGEGGRVRVAVLLVCLVLAAAGASVAAMRPAEVRHRVHLQDVPAVAVPDSVCGGGLTPSECTAELGEMGPTLEGAPCEIVAPSAEEGGTVPDGADYSHHVWTAEDGTTIGYAAEEDSTIYTCPIVDSVPTRSGGMAGGAGAIGAVLVLLEVAVLARWHRRARIAQVLEHGGTVPARWARAMLEETGAADGAALLEDVHRGHVVEVDGRTYRADGAGRVEVAPAEVETCQDCGRPLVWLEDLEDYRHTSAGSCWLYGGADGAPSGQSAPRPGWLEPAEVLEEEYRARCEAIGAEEGTAAATWLEVADTAHAARILEGIDGCEDVAEVPAADLSGQWADGRDVRDVAREALEDVAAAHRLEVPVLRAVLETAGRLEVLAGAPYGPTWCTADDTAEDGTWWRVADTAEGFTPAYCLVWADGPDVAAEVAAEVAGGRLEDTAETLEAHPCPPAEVLVTLEDTAAERYTDGFHAAAVAEVERVCRTFLPSDAAEEIRGWAHLPCLEVRADVSTTGDTGRGFLARVCEDVAEALEYGRLDPHRGAEDPADVAHEVADGAVPIYTHELFAVLLETGAYREDLEDYRPPADGATLEDLARVAVYAVAERLAASLLEYATDGR